MVLRRLQAKDLEQLALAVGRFGDRLEDLAKADPPADRAATDHPEIRRLALEFDAAAVIVKKAVDAKFMTAQQYRMIARHFAAIAKDMAGGAVKEATAHKRRSPAGRGRASPKSRKPPPRRR